jgi:hypothetical protein
MTDASDRAREALEEVALAEACRRFVETQSEGEWGDDLIAKDAAKLTAFVKSRLTAAIATAHAAGRAEGMEEAARWHDECEAAIAAIQASAELVGAISLTIGDMETRRRRHRDAAAAIRVRITTPAGGESHG